MPDPCPGSSCLLRPIKALVGTPSNSQPQINSNNCNRVPTRCLQPHFFLIRNELSKISKQKEGQLSACMFVAQSTTHLQAPTVPLCVLLPAPCHLPLKCPRNTVHNLLLMPSQQLALETSAHYQLPMVRMLENLMRHITDPSQALDSIAGPLQRTPCIHAAQTCFAAASLTDETGQTWFCCPGTGWSSHRLLKGTVFSVPAPLNLQDAEAQLLVVYRHQASHPPHLQSGPAAKQQPASEPACRFVNKYEALRDNHQANTKHHKPPSTAWATFSTVS